MKNLDEYGTTQDGMLRMLEDINATGGLKGNPELRTSVRNFISDSVEAQGKRQKGQAGIPGFTDHVYGSGYSLLTGKSFPGPR